MKGKSNIYLIGYRAAGKTTISALLGSLLGKKIVHLDEEIERGSGSLAALVKKIGWDGFREMESRELEKVSRAGQCVVDCGGGIIERADNVQLMQKTGTVVFLDADISDIIKRLRADKGNARPSLTGKGAIDEVPEVINRRRPLYLEAADITIMTGKKEPAEIASEIAGKLKGK